MATGEIEELLDAIKDEAWAGLRVSTMDVEGIDALLDEPEMRQLIEAGMHFGSASTMAYFKDRGWLNIDAIEADTGG